MPCCLWKNRFRNAIVAMNHNAKVAMYVSRHNLTRSNRTASREKHTKNEVEHIEDLHSIVDKIPCVVHGRTGFAAQ